MTKDEQEAIRLLKIWRANDLREALIKLGELKGNAKEAEQDVFDSTRALRQVADRLRASDRALRLNQPPAGNVADG